MYLLENLATLSHRYVEPVSCSIGFVRGVGKIPKDPLLELVVSLGCGGLTLGKRRPNGLNSKVVILCGSYLLVSQNESFYPQ